jgi:hypothetical protein
MTDEEDTEKDYEYHKRNDYPGERKAEKKRVSDRAKTAEKKSDARVAEKGRTDNLKADARVADRARSDNLIADARVAGKGRTDNLKADARVADRARSDNLIADARVAGKGRRDDELMDSEIERSDAKAREVNRTRKTADILGLITVAVVMVIVLVGFSWSYTAIQQQSGDINSLRLQLDDTKTQLDDTRAQLERSTTENVQLSNANKQLQLYKDFLVLTADVKEEVKNLKEFNTSHVNDYQLCSNYVQRDNNINLALSRFAEKEIIYYKQIAVLADKLQCNVKINAMDDALTISKAADEQLYVQTKYQCDRLMTGANITEEKIMQSKIDWQNAMINAQAKTTAFTKAEKGMIECFA